MFDSYRVAVKLTLVNGVSSGLALISRNLTHTGKNVDLLTAKLHKATRTWTMLGAAGAGVTMGAIGLMKGPIEAARKYTEELAYMRDQAGLTAGEIGRIRVAAVDLSRSVGTVSELEGIKSIMDLRSIFGASHLKMAIDAAPYIAKTQGILAQMGVKDAENMSFELAKSLELLGHGKSVQDFVTHLDLMTKGMQAFHAKILPKDWLSTVTYLRASKYGFSDEFMFKYLPSLMLEYKGSAGGGARGPGNALMSLVANIVNGQLSQKSFREFERLKMIDPSKVHHIKGHGLTAGAGAVRGWEIAQSNPIQWALQYVMPAMREAGITSQAQMLQEAAYLAPNRTSQDMLVQFMIQAWKLERDKENINRATGLAGFEKLRKESPELAMKALDAQWFNVEYKLAFDTLPKLIDGVNFLSRKIQKVSDFMDRHPNAGTYAMYGLGGIAALGSVAAVAGTIGAITNLVRAVGVVSASGAVGNLPMFAAGITKLGGALAAIYAGWQAGQWAGNKINNHLSSGTKDTIGRTIANLLAAVGVKEAQDAVDSESRYIRSQHQSRAMINNTIVMPDGRVLAHVVTKEQTKESAKPQAGANRFDGRMTPAHVGASGNW